MIDDELFKNNNKLFNKNEDLTKTIIINKKENNKYKNIDKYANHTNDLMNILDNYDTNDIENGFEQDLENEEDFEYTRELEGLNPSEEYNDEEYNEEKLENEEYNEENIEEDNEEHNEENIEEDNEEVNDEVNEEDNEEDNDYTRDTSDEDIDYDTLNDLEVIVFDE